MPLEMEDVVAKKTKAKRHGRHAHAAHASASHAGVAQLGDTPIAIPRRPANAWSPGLAAGTIRADSLITAGFWT